MKGAGLQRVQLRRGTFAPPGSRKTTPESPRRFLLGGTCDKVLTVNLSNPGWRRRISYMSRQRPPEIRCDESGLAVTDLTDYVGQFSKSEIACLQLLRRDRPLWTYTLPMRSDSLAPCSKNPADSAPLSHRRSDCQRVERSNSRAGLSPAVVQRFSRRAANACLQQVTALHNRFAGVEC